MAEMPARVRVSTLPPFIKYRSLYTTYAVIPQRVAEISVFTILMIKWTGIVPLFLLFIIYSRIIAITIELEALARASPPMPIFMVLVNRYAAAKFTAIPIIEVNIGVLPSRIA